MGKYIIEIPEDKITDFVGSTHLLMPYSMAGHKGHHDTGLPIEPYTEPDLERVKADAYNDGYKAGREAKKVRQIDLERVKKTAHDDGYSAGYQAGREDLNRVMSGVEQVKKEAYAEGFKDGQYAERNGLVANYAQEQEEELGIQGYFKNGEEVIDADGTKAVILHVSEDNYCQVYTENGCIENWHIHTYKFLNTGRHFPEIAAVLEKMKEG